MLHSFCWLLSNHDVSGVCFNTLLRSWKWCQHTEPANFPAEYLFLIKSSARSITVSNTTGCCNLTFLLLVFIYICSLEWFVFSRSNEFLYLMNCFRFLLVSSLLLTGQLPTLSALFFKISLLFCSLFHWTISWSTVCVPCLHGHTGLIIIFNLCK